MSLRHPVKKIALATCAPLVFLGAIEGVLRLSGEGPRTPLTLGFGRTDPVHDITEEDRELVWRFIPNRSEFAGGWEFKFATNELGLRGELPPRKKAANAFRIVCLGDSTAFGNINTYPDELAAMLADALPGRRIEVINGGIPGFSARQGYELLARDLIGYSPDLVTWCFGFNNCRRALGERSDDVVIDERKRGVGVATWFVRHTALGALLSRLRTTTTDSDSTNTTIRISPERFAELTSDAARLARECGASFVAIEQPHAFDRVGTSPIEPVKREQLDHEVRLLDAQRAALEARCAHDGIPFVPMHRYFASLPDDDGFIGPCPEGDVVHPGPIGLRFFAERLAADLGRFGELPADTIVSVPDSPIDPPAFAVADLDGDGDQEVVVATTRDGGVIVSIVDPRRGTMRTVPLDLPAPTHACALSRIPALGNEIVVTRMGIDSTLIAESLSIEGSERRLKPLAFATSPGIEWVRVVPVDLDDDDRPEYALECGPVAAPNCVLLDQRLGVLAAIPLAFEPESGVSILSGIVDADTEREAIVMSGLVRGLGTELLVRSEQPRPFARPANYLVRNRPCTTIYARGRDRKIVRLCWRAPALFVEVDAKVRALFPWGAAPCRARAPRLGLVTSAASSTGAEAVIVASLAGRRLEWRRIDAAGVNAASFTELSEQP